MECNVVMGLAYHGIAFSTATSCALFQKYGETVSYCYDRKVPDKKGRILCGYTLQDGDKVVIADLTNEEAGEKGLGPALLAEKYGTKVYSIITEKDVVKAVKDFKL